jgi:hypothetical protein
MANTYTLIASNTLGSSAASVTFSAIPNTYTDLVLRISARSDSPNGQGAADGLFVRFNSSDAGQYSWTMIRSTGTAVTSDYNYTVGNFYAGDYFGTNGYAATASTFSSAEFYIPSYASSNKKPLSVVGVNETNASAAYMGIEAALWNNTSAISNISLAPVFANNFVSGSSFFLYGIKNS